MAGTGIGTFNDRLRDAVRGGGPFDGDPRIQGFVSGLYTDPNGDPVNGTSRDQKAGLLHDQDLIKVGLTGNLKDYTFTDSDRRDRHRRPDRLQRPAGRLHRRSAGGDQLRRRPRQRDAVRRATYKLPLATSMADRIRMQTLSLATTAFSQGVSFWQAGVGCCAASPSTATATTPATGSTCSTHR